MTTIYAAFDTAQSILFVASMIFVITMMQFVQNYLTSVGWHKLASVSWNG
jgi:hypothetical protein